MKIRIKVPTQLAESLEEKAKKAVEEAKEAVANAKKEKQLKQLEELKAKVDDKIAMLKGKKGKKQKVEESLEEAPEEKIDEVMDPETSWAAVAAGMAAIGLTSVAIDRMHSWWKKKHPKSFKAAQKVSGAIDRAAGNTPGQGYGVDTSKTFGPQN